MPPDFYTVYSIYSINYLHYGKRTGKAIEGRAGRPRQKDERSASGQRNERADGRVQHGEHCSGRPAQSPFVRQPNGFRNLFREPSQPIRTPVRFGLKFLPDQYRKTRPSPRLHHPSPRRQRSGRLPGQRDLRLRTQQRGAYRQVRRPLQVRGTGTSVGSDSGIGSEQRNPAGESKHGRYPQGTYSQQTGAAQT